MWNLDALRAHIRSLDPGRTYLVEVVDSIGRNNDIFLFHSLEAKDAFEGIVDDEEPAGAVNLEFVFGDSDRQSDYNLAKLSSEANLIGCIHAVRNQFDLFGQLINGLLLEVPLPIASCSIFRAHDRLPSSGLKDELTNLLQSHWFTYVNGFINTTKHRMLVQHGFSVSFQEGRCGVKVGAFEYGGKHFPAYWGTEALQGVVNVKNSLVACGRTLNSVCLSGDDA